MSLPQLFWLVSSAASALAAVILILLILHRDLANRRMVALNADRERYVALLKAGAGNLPGEHLVADDVLTDLGVELLEMVRGADKARFATRAQRLGIADRLHARLRRGSVRTRILAAVALANLADERTNEALKLALHDGNPLVRLAAALSLAATGHAPPAREVMKCLLEGRDELPSLAITLLEDMARTDVEDVRSMLLDPNIAAPIKAAASNALARGDDFAAIPTIVSLAIAADPYTDELVPYLDALAEIEHPAGAPAILHCLNSPSPKARAAAARAAGRIIVEEALDRLTELLGDPDWWVRFHAARALLRFGPRGESRLAEQSKEPARETAALTLAEHAAQ